MIRITRFELHQVRQMFSRALGIDRNSQLDLLISPIPDGYRIGTTHGDISIAYSRQYDYLLEPIVLPWRAVWDLAGRNHTELIIRSVNGRTVATWQERGRRNRKEYGPSSSIDQIALPPRTEAGLINPPQLISALAACSELTDGQRSRYALNSIWVQPDLGQLTASDGRQALFQSEFKLPGSDPQLIPDCNVWTYAKQLIEGPVRTSLIDDRLLIDTGKWAVALKLQQGRYPDLERAVPDSSASDTAVRIHERDVVPIRQYLAKLSHARHQAVTLDLDNGRVTLLAKATDGTIRELEASESNYSGPAVCIVCERGHLGMTLKLGLREIRIDSCDHTVLCRDATRRYVWMPLCSSERLGPSCKSRARSEGREPVMA